MRRELLFMLAGAGLLLAGAYVSYYLPGALTPQAPPPAMAVPAKATATPPKDMARETAEAMRGGGYILLIRHGRREQWDSINAFDTFELATGVDASTTSFKNAVCLTPQGLEEGRMVGKILRLAGVPIGTVVSSPSCRARQTAMMAFDRIDITSIALMQVTLLNRDNTPEFKEELGKLLRSVPVAAGTNTAIVGHENTIRKYPDLFAVGKEFLNDQMVLESGFYVLRREMDGSMHIVYKYMTLGEFASNAVTLHAAPGRATEGITRTPEDRPTR